MDPSETTRDTEKRKCETPGCDNVAKNVTKKRKSGRPKRYRSRYCASCTRKKKGVANKGICQYPGCELSGFRRGTSAGSGIYCNKHRLVKQKVVTEDEFRKLMNLKARFGMSWGEFQQRVREQAGRCAICHKDIVTSGLKYAQVDHHHGTGEVRGLLCGNCNRSLAGLEFLFSHNLLLSAMQYLAQTNRQMSNFYRRYSPDPDSLDRISH